MDEKNSIQDFTILWSKDGESIYNDNEVNDVFVLKHATLEDAGRYQCHFQSGMENRTSTSSIINIYSPMNVTKTPTNQNLVEGSNATLFCETFLDKKLLNKTSISWFKNDVFIHSDTSKPFPVNSDNDEASNSNSFLKSKLIFPIARKVINSSL